MESDEEGRERSRRYARAAKRSDPLRDPGIPFRPMGPGESYGPGSQCPACGAMAGVIATRTPEGTWNLELGMPEPSRVVGWEWSCCGHPTEMPTGGGDELPVEVVEWARSLPVPMSPLSWLADQEVEDDQR